MLDALANFVSLMQPLSSFAQMSKLALRKVDTRAGKLASTTLNLEDPVRMKPAMLYQGLDAIAEPNKQLTAAANTILYESEQRKFIALLGPSGCGKTRTIYEAMSRRSSFFITCRTLRMGAAHS